MNATAKPTLALVIAGILSLIAHLSCHLESRIVTSTYTHPLHSIRVMAILPASDTLVDEIVVALSSHGVQVMSPLETRNLMTQLGFPLERYYPDNAGKLKAQGVDAYLLLVQTTYGLSREIETATVQVKSTHTGAVLGDLTWQNGHHNLSGGHYPKDHCKDPNEAGEEIAAALVAGLNLAGQAAQ
jgi:hypothetical protein